jgi:hypothetical protein
VTNVETWALDQVATRELVDELIALHLEDGIPEPADVLDIALTLTVWPLAHQVVRFGTAALALVDAGSGHEAHVLVRAAIEHTITAHYLTELGEDAAAAWVNAQSVQADRTINLGIEYGVAWWTVHRILVASAIQVLGQAAPTTMIGIDETRARSVRWFLKESGWARSDPWMTSIVDLDPSHPGGIIGLVPGRSGACVEAWLALQTKEFRDGVTVVAIDPSVPYASGIRRALPKARIVLDHFHLVMLANKILTDVRQRVQHEQQGRRGMKVDPAWAHRRLLLRPGNELGPQGPGPVEDRLRHRRPDQRDQCRLGRQGAPASDAFGARPERVHPARDLDPPDPVPGGLRGRRHARGNPARRHDREVVAGN